HEVVNNVLYVSQRSDRGSLQPIPPLGLCQWSQVARPCHSPRKRAGAMFKQFIKNKIASYILTLTLALSIILGLLVGAWLSGRYYQKEIHSTRAALDECKSNSQKLLTEVEHQNAGITTIRE